MYRRVCRLCCDINLKNLRAEMLNLAARRIVSKLGSESSGVFLYRI
jgi:hypothetical protein